MEKDKRALRQAQLNREAMERSTLPPIAKDSKEAIQMNFERVHNAKTMEDAVQRHYDSLKKLESQKMQERADFHWRMQAEREIMDQEKEARSRQKQENMEQLTL